MIRAIHSLTTSFVVLIAFLSGPAVAEVTVEVVGGEGSRIPIAVLSFHGDEEAQDEHRIGQVIAADLMRSSALRVLEAPGLGAGVDDEVDHSYFSSTGTDMVVIGKVSKKGRTFEARYALVDIARKTRILEETIIESKLGMRHLAHRIAYKVHELLTC